MNNPLQSLPSDTKRAIVVIVLIILGAFFTLAAFGGAGIAGSDVYRLFAYLDANYETRHFGP